MLPDSWIDRIFKRLEGRYGSLFIDRWRGCDMANVRETWAEELDGFRDQPDRIAHALKSLAEEKFPPTLPEFIAACRRAPAKEPLALPYKPTPEDEARANEHIHRAASALMAKINDGIDVHWATHPRSEMHLGFIFDAAKKDARFDACIDEMVTQGICTANGKLLRVYRDSSWHGRV